MLNVTSVFSSHSLPFLVQFIFLFQILFQSLFVETPADHLDFAHETLQQLVQLVPLYVELSSQ